MTDSIVNSKNHKKILLLVSLEILGFVLTDMLNSNGFNDVTYVETLEEARKEISQRDFDLLITDNTLGKGQTGFSFIKELETDKNLKDLHPMKTILMASSASEPAGDGFLKKPFDMKEFIDLVNHLLE